MKISILDAKYVNDAKGGAPVYISDVQELNDLYDLAAVCINNHIAVSVFNENYRKGENWLSSDFIAVDFDDGTLTADMIHAQLTALNINHAILASKNHLKDKLDGKGIIERFHIFLPLSERITDPSLYGAIAENVCRLFNWHPDAAATKDKCRYYFQHREALHIYEDGKCLDVPEYVELKLKQDKIRGIADRLIDKERKADAERFKDSTALDCFKRTKYYKMLMRGELNQDGFRYGNSNMVIGGMIRCGLSVFEAMSIFDKFATYGAGFTRESIMQRFNKWR